MRLTLAVFTVAFAAGLSVASLADPPPAGDKQQSQEDVLGNLVVVAGGARALPKIGVLPSLAADPEDVTLRSVIQRDLDLCGEFELLPDSQAPDGLYLSDSPVDVKAWAAKGVEAVVKVTGKKSVADRAELRAQAFFVKKGASPVFDKKFLVPAADLRNESHRLSDLVIGALTGQNGGFASHMAFASGTGSTRRVYTMDADGHDAKPVSPADKTGLAPAYNKNGDLFYAAGKSTDLYQVYTQQGALVPTNVKGSVYGIAFSKTGTVAASIGVSDTIKVYSGPDFSNLTEASTVGMALHPAFTPSGKLAFVGEGKYGQRVYVDNKPISPDSLHASSPTFCNHPDGVKVVFAVGVGVNTDLVSTTETGAGLARLTQNQGRNGYPACSPDGRLVAFFTTRTSNEGPGLYIMRVDGGRPKRVSTLVGDSLRWEPLPPGKAVEVKP